ncbi:MAG TPA: hypothetical protein VMC42_02180, partial [Methanoregulaceae archaeon]|nr:hypothetical protein [Methanoregulaceae archaeon]
GQYRAITGTRGARLIQTEPNETIVRTIAERPDSVVIGNPSKGGEIKVYFNVANLEDAEARVMNAIKIRDLAARLHSGQPATLAEIKKA